MLFFKPKGVVANILSVFGWRTHLILLTIWQTLLLTKLIIAEFNGLFHRLRQLLVRHLFVVLKTSSYRGFLITTRVIVIITLHYCSIIDTRFPLV